MKYFFCSLLILLLFFHRGVYAQQSHFFLDSNLHYQFFQSGLAKVSQKTTVTNLNSEFQPSNIVTTLGFLDLKNVSASDRFGAIFPVVNVSSQSSQITIAPHQPGAGINRKTTVNLVYQTESLMQKLGNIYVISIPAPNPNESYTIYDIVVDSKELGTPIFVDPPTTKNTWHLDQIKTSGITLLYWSQQSRVQDYFVSIKYVLTNKKLYSVNGQINLPFDSLGQTVAIEKLNPPPNQVRIDPSGNWVANYYLSPNASQTVLLESRIQLTQPDRIASNSSVLAKQAYKNTLEQLSSSSGQTVSCQLASKTLANELKKNQINSRYVLGNLFPTRNALHCWIEYLDPESYTWLSADPYLAYLTKHGGYLDFWDPLHIKLVTTVDSQNNLSNVSEIVVKPAGFDSPFPKNSQLDLRADFGKTTISGFQYSGKIYLQNSGSTALNNLKLVVSTKKVPVIKTHVSIATLPPMGTMQLTVDLEKVPWTFAQDDIITLEINGRDYSYPVSFIPIYQSSTFLTVGGLFVITAIFIITQISRSLFFQRQKK